jgi:hypothetical protein
VLSGFRKFFLSPFSLDFNWTNSQFCLDHPSIVIDSIDVGGAGFLKGELFCCLAKVDLVVTLDLL